MRRYGTGIIFAITFIATFVIMCWHWRVQDCYASCWEKANGMPWAIVSSDAPATPSSAENALFAESIPTGQWVSAGRHRITHYCPESCCNGGNRWKTASGAPMVIGRTVAAHRREFSFGTKLLINDHEYVVEDRGVDVGQIDILCHTHHEASDKGLYYTEIFVWKEY